MENRLPLRKAVAKVFISKFFDDGAIPVFAAQRNGGQRHTVKGVGFDHGVNGHIAKHQPIS